MQPDSRTLPLVPGRVLDRYELLCPIAEGGMAVVWLARLRGVGGLDTLFAIKVLSSAFDGTPAARTMLIDEARIAARIRHPNVAQIIELGETDGILYLVLEWVDGASLATLRRAVARAGEAFPLRIALKVLADACWGLEAAHGLCDRDGTPLCVVHRDVSPQNIVVGAGGHVKVIDFGIAKAERRVSEATRAGDIKGKVQYMAPEQVAGESLDHRTDLWAVGAVLHHLMTGRPPFGDAEEFAILRRLLAGEAPQLLPTHPSIDPILQRTLAVDPADRYESAAALGNALESVLATLGASVTPPELGAFVSRWAGGQLEERRHALESAVATVDAVTTPAEPGRARTAATVVSPGERPAPGEVTAQATVRTTAGTTVRHRRPSGSRWVLWAVLGVLGLVVLALVVPRAISRGDKPAAPSSALPVAAPAATPAAAPPAAPASVPSPQADAGRDGAARELERVTEPVPAPAPKTYHGRAPQPKPKPAPPPTSQPSKNADDFTSAFGERHPGR